MCLKLWNSPLLKQVWVTTALYFNMVGNGLVLGVTGAMLPALRADPASAGDLDSASWITGSVGVGALMVIILATPVMAVHGRRCALLGGLSIGIVSPFIMFYSADIKLLIFGRFLAGACLGITNLVGAVIVGEYSAPVHRGVFLNMKCTLQFVGAMLAHILGHYIHWRTVSLLIAIPYFINFLMVFTWPESPSWLASQKRYDEATTTFYWLRGKNEETSRELDAMIATQKELDFYRDKTLRKKVMIFLKKFKQRNLLKPVGVYLFVAILLETSGRHMFPAYALQFIQEMDKDKSRSFIYTLIIDLIMIVSTAASVILVRLFKRRTLLLSSGTSSAIVILAVGLYYYLQSMSLISDHWDSLCLVLFGSYFVLVNLGCTPISLALIGELFPLEHRTVGSSISGEFIGIFMLVTLKVTPIMLATIKIYGTFAVYGSSMAVCLIVLYNILPETKDKSLPEIEEYFSDKANGRLMREQEEGLTYDY